MDVDVIGRAQRGDEEAFAALAAATDARFHSVANRILHDLDVAEDAVQQALLAVWRDLSQLRDPAHFDAWSHRVMVRACYAESARTRATVPGVRDALPDTAIPAEAFAAIIDRDELERGFQRLSTEHRMVVVLHHCRGLKLDEVAQALGIPAGTVRSRLHHAMRSLRAALEADARLPAQHEPLRVGATRT